MIPEIHVTSASLREMASLPLAENDNVTADQAGRNRHLVRNMILVLAKILEIAPSLDGMRVDV